MWEVLQKTQKPDQGFLGSVLQYEVKLSQGDYIFTKLEHLVELYLRCLISKKFCFEIQH